MSRITLLNWQIFRSSPDYFLLVKFFTDAKQQILGLRSNKNKTSSSSLAMRKIQQKFSIAISNMMREKTDFSIFCAPNFEKLQNSQYKLEEDRKFGVWLRKMNDLDFQDRTRSFFSEIRSKYRAKG